MTVDAGGAPTVGVRPEGLWTVEFRNDVLPLLDASCRSCHASTGANAPALVNGVSPRLSMFDSTLPAGLASDVRAYRAIARDGTGLFSHGTGIPNGDSTYRYPQTSRYVRAIQARASLLAWKIYGERLDGRLDTDFPVAGVSGSEDLDYSAGTCPAPTLLTIAQKGVITRWIDLGSPIDLDRPLLRYSDDNLVPLLTVSLYAVAGQVELRVGIVDLESGVDPASLLVRIEVPGGATVDTTMGDLAFDPDSGVGTRLLSLVPSQFSEQSPLRVSAGVADNRGNRERLEIVVGSVGPRP